MPATDHGADQPERAEPMNRAIALLVEALEIVDNQCDRPDSGPVARHHRRFAGAAALLKALPNAASGPLRTRP